MLSYVLRRLTVAVPTILVLIVLSYLLMQAAPGGPWDSDRSYPQATVDALDRKYGLDDPLPVQIGRYLWNVVTGFDFGPSLYYKDRSVSDVIAQGFPVTLTYGVWAFAVAVLVGGSLGVAAAVWHNSWLDHLAVGISIGAQVLPNFVMAPILVLVFTLWLGWLPAAAGRAGRGPMW